MDNNEGKYKHHNSTLYSTWVVPPNQTFSQLVLVFAVLFFSADICVLQLLPFCVMFAWTWLYNVILKHAHIVECYELFQYV